MIIFYGSFSSARKQEIFTVNRSADASYGRSSGRATAQRAFVSVKPGNRAALDEFMLSYFPVVNIIA